MSIYRRKLMIANILGRSDGNINYPGLVAAWNIKKEGKDNDHPDRGWLRDLTGHGHDFELLGLLYAEMSGYGGYDTAFSNYNDWIMNNSGGNNSNPDFDVKYTSTYFKLQRADGGLISSTNTLRYRGNKTAKFKFKINTDGEDLKLVQYLYNLEGQVKANILLKNINNNNVYEKYLPTYPI